MNAALLIARREFLDYLRTWLGYLVIAGILMVWGLVFNAAVLGSGPHRSSDVLATFFYYTSGLTMFAAAMISMRLLAEERQTGSMNLLYSSPVKDAEIVGGKFLGGLLFLCVFLASTSYMPALIFVNGKVSMGHIAAGYLGLFLVGSASLAIGTFASALTRSQILSAILCGCFIVALIVLWMVARVTERPLSDVFTALAFHNEHFPPFEHGLVHLRDVTYYAGVTYVFLFGATRVLEARRWR